MADGQAPTTELWATRYRIISEQQREWRMKCAEFESLYEQTWVVDGVPTNIQITMPSTARAIVDEATDHSDFIPDWLKIRMPTYGLTNDAEDRSSKLRQFLIGWLDYQMEYANDVSPYRDWIKNMYLHGKAVYKTVCDWESWPQVSIPEGTSNDDARIIREEVSAEREFAGVPAVLRSIYPLAIYEDPSLGEKRYAIEVYTGYAPEVLPQYENWVPQRMENGRTLTRSDYEDQNARLAVWDCYELDRRNGKPGIWHQVLISEGEFAVNEASSIDDTMISPANGPDSQPVWLENEPFPYTIKFSGLGRQSSGKYEEKARGILSAVVSLLKAEARRLTQLDSIIAQMAWPTIFVTGSRARFSVSFGPNVVNYVPPGTTVTPVTPQIPAGPVQTALATLQSGIERGTFGSVIRGDKPPNTTSAAQLAILSGQARLRFGAVNAQHQAALADVSQKVAHIVKNVIDEPVTIWQSDDTDAENSGKFVIKPGEIPERLVVRYEISTDPREERDREVQLASFLFEKGAIDLEEFRERAGIRNTSAMRRRVIRDKVLMESPAVIAALGEQYILESGYDIESLTLEKAMRDMLIVRRQQQMQQEIMGGQMGGQNSAGSPEAQQSGITPTPNGGAPGQGGAPNGVPTPATARQATPTSATLHSQPSQSENGGRVQFLSKT